MKPESHCKTLANDDSQLPQIKRRRLNLTIRVLAAQGIDLDARSTPNAFVKCELHVESSAEKVGKLLPEGKNKSGEWKQRTPLRHSREPDFAGHMIRFEDIEDVVPELSFIR